VLLTARLAHDQSITAFITIDKPLARYSTENPGDGCVEIGFGGPDPALKLSEWATGVDTERKASGEPLARGHCPALS
jgi:hypothetical protein